MAVLATALLAVPAAAEEHENSWKVDLMARVELGIVSSESSDQDDELIVNGDGGYLRGQLSVSLEDDNTEFRLEADRIQVERFGSATGRPRYDRDRFTLSVTQGLGEDWEVQLRGRIYDDLVTVESSDTDEVSAAIRIEYEPVLDHRVRATVTWREREYADTAGPGGTASQGDGIRVDLDYRYRFGRYHYLGLDLRAEEIDSANPVRNYTRESAALSYTHPLTRDLRIRPAMEWRHTVFDGRIAPDGQPREDDQYVPEIELLWWPGNWRIEAEAKYIFSDSNDPVRDREGYRVSLSVGYVF
ncbi:hypothetical protein OZN62_08360 [Aurantiacibacter sp. MUD11]|uniref:hypothetical protein n=1 Tax=Aurantiacibacter sp. MUD11 TaxID=3003265 RepID=UPI0022AB4A55|nr:hypothetical protein [Aurantiacibacter sp. MUD11]WAT16952.1 hypothetical protein OZN62_08360 [Aurantiacibacter sp. MUD11]